jgi:hypothetical protein
LEETAAALSTGLGHNDGFGQGSGFDEGGLAGANGGSASPRHLSAVKIKRVAPDQRAWLLPLFGSASPVIGRSPTSRELTLGVPFMWTSAWSFRALSFAELLF